MSRWSVYRCTSGCLLYVCMCSRTCTYVSCVCRAISPMFEIWLVVSSRCSRYYCDWFDRWLAKSVAVFSLSHCNFGSYIQTPPHYSCALFHSSIALPLFLSDPRPSRADQQQRWPRATILLTPYASFFLYLSISLPLFRNLVRLICLSYTSYFSYMFYTKQHALSFGIVSIVSNLLLFVSYYVSYLFVILSSHFPSSSTTCLNLALLPWGAESLLFASVYIYPQAPAKKWWCRRKIVQRTKQIHHRCFSRCRLS